MPSLNGLLVSMSDSRPGGSEFETIFLSSVFSTLTSAEACKKSSQWLLKESCVSTDVRKPGNTCVSPTTMI